MDELQAIKQALGFLLEQENIRQQEIAALNEKIDALSGDFNNRSSEFSQWVDDRNFNDFAGKYGEELSPYNDRLRKIHQDDDYDVVRDTYDAFNSGDNDGDVDNFVKETKSALDAYLKDIGIPEDVKVEVKADMDGDGETETVIDEKPAEEPTEKPAADDDEKKKFMDSINSAVDKELAKQKK